MFAQQKEEEVTVATHKSPEACIIMHASFQS